MFIILFFNKKPQGKVKKLNNIFNLVKFIVIY